MSIGDAVVGLMGGMGIGPGAQARGQLGPAALLAPGSSQTPPGGQSPTTQQPTPSLSSPPPADLAQIYMQQMARDRAADGFDRGLAGIAAANAAPGTAATMYNALAPAPRNTGEQLQTLMQLQNIQLQRQRAGSIVNSINDPSPNGLAAQTGMSPAALQTLYFSNPDAFATTISKGIEMKQGLAGPEPRAALIRANQAWAIQNAQTDPTTGQPIPDPNNPGQLLLKPGVTKPNYLSSEGALTAFTGQQADAAKEKVACSAARF